MKSILDSLPTDWLIPKEKFEQIENLLKDHYHHKPDPWGLDIHKALYYLKLIYPAYKYYFKVRVFGAENVIDKPYVVVANHTGQLPIDGMLLLAAFAVDVPCPRILRGMVERFLASFPFLGKLASECGSVLGDRENGKYLLKRGESLLVFPEGVRGIAKNSPEFYQQKEFTKGFFRLALNSKTDILPVSIIGAEEFYPYVVHLKKLANFLKLPALPVTPLFPLFGLLGAMPLPSPVDIYIGEPYSIPAELTSDSPDKYVDEHIYNIEEKIKQMTKVGLENRRSFLFNKKVKI